MGKVKARDIIEGWPWPHSATHPPIDAYVSSNGIVITVQSSKDLRDGAYHARQSGGEDAFREHPSAIETIRLSIQRSTGKRFVYLGGHRVSLEGYPAGHDIIPAGLCGMLKQHPLACFTCPFGHMTECHFPRTCAETLKDVRCSHADRETEQWATAMEGRWIQ